MIAWRRRAYALGVMFTIHARHGIIVLPNGIFILINSMQWIVINRVRVGCAFNNIGRFARVKRISKAIIFDKHFNNQIILCLFFACS